jgi:hypothetical protein
MTEQDKKELAAHFNEALEHEDLHLSQAARFLNLNPCYITWIRNEKYWSDISAAAWSRFEAWHLTRGKLSDFQVPEGEAIWEKKKPAPKTEPEGIDEHSPDNLLPPETPKQKRKYTRHDQGEGKTVKIILQKEEIEQLKKRVDLLTEDNNRLAQSVKELHTNNLILLSENEKLGSLISELSKKIFVIEDESLAVMRQEIKDLQEGIGHLVTIPKPYVKPGIILFQRNIYKS